MNFSTEKKCAVCALVCLFFTVLSLATPWWFVKDSKTIGLFQTCSDGECQRNAEESDAIVAAQAFTIICVIILLGLMFFCVVFEAWKYSGKGIQVMFIAACSALLIAMVDVTAHKSDNYSYGSSYVLGWISFASLLISTLISFILLKDREGSIFA